MNALFFITRLVWGVLFMAFIAVAAVVTFALEILWEFLSAAWFVLVVGKVRKF